MIQTQKNDIGYNPNIRTSYIFRPPFIFDCRCHGAIQIKTDAIYRKFLAVVDQALRDGRSLQNLNGELNGYVNENLLKHGDNIIKYTCNPYPKHIRQLAAQRFERLLISANETIIDKYCADHGQWQDTKYARRMGVGDIIVMISMLQRIEDKVGVDNMVVVYDPEYPSYDVLMKASGLNIYPYSQLESIEDVNTNDLLPTHTMKDRGGSVTISMRKHFLANRQGDTSVCPYGTAQGFAGAQMLWDLGWEKRIKWNPFRVGLEIPVYNKKLATYKKAGASCSTTPINNNTTQKKAGGITINPIELTRGNKYVTPAVWAAVLDKYNPQQLPVLVGCTPEQRPLTERFMEDAQKSSKRTIKYSIIVEGLMTWLGIISRARLHITGNNCGLWLGIATETPMIVISFRSSEHGTQWEPKRNWFGTKDAKRIKIINQNNMPTPTE